MRNNAALSIYPPEIRYIPFLASVVSMKFPFFLVQFGVFSTLFIWCEKFKLRQKYQVNRNFAFHSHYPYFVCVSWALYLPSSLFSPPSLGKFSINCYSFNFMHESCLKGKMLVDQPPRSHPSFQPPTFIVHTLFKIEVYGIQNFYGPDGEVDQAGSPARSPSTCIWIVYCFNFTHRPDAKAFPHCLPFRDLA